jgi:hypothetical protein
MQNPEERHLERGVGIHIQSWRVALKKGKKEFCALAFKC